MKNLKKKIGDLIGYDVPLFDRTDDQEMTRFFGLLALICVATGIIVGVIWYFQ